MSTLATIEQIRALPPPFENYGVSTSGYIFSTDHHVTGANKKTQYRRGRKLKPVPTRDGYSRVMLSCPGLKKILQVHRIVATAFIPNPENKPQVNHKNGVKSDNRVENLEWATRSENQTHRCRVLGLGIGDDNHSSKLSTAEVLDIRTLAAFGADGVTLAEAFSTSCSNISDIIRRKSWKHL